jgi:hypothetical protein
MVQIIAWDGFLQAFFQNGQQGGLDQLVDKRGVGIVGPRGLALLAARVEEEAAGGDFSERGFSKVDDGRWFPGAFHQRR